MEIMYVYRYEWKGWLGNYKGDFTENSPDLLKIKRLKNLLFSACITLPKPWSIVLKFFLQNSPACGLISMIFWKNDGNTGTLGADTFSSFFFHKNAVLWKFVTLY